MKNLQRIIKESTEKNHKIQTKSRTVSFFRFFIFILFAVEIYKAITKNESLDLVIGFIFFIIFIFLVFISNNLSEIILFNKNVIIICNDIINGKPNDNNYNEFEINQNHSYCFDLDILGKKSLFEKLNRCQINFGMSKLHFFLLNHLLKTDEIINRQDSIKELSTKVVWNIKFLATAKSKEVSSLNEKNVLNWNINNNVFESKLLNILLRIIPAFNVLLILLFLFLKFSLFNLLFIIIPIFTSLIFNRIYNMPINEIYTTVNVKSNELKKFVSLFLLIEEEKFTANQNILLQKELISTYGVTASNSIKKLTKLIDNFENKNIAIVGGVLNVLFLWDLQFASRIEKHISIYKTYIPKWFNAVSEMEALISFGLFAYQNTEYSYPIPSDSSNAIEIINVSHPLIPKQDRINNNFKTHRNNNVTIITGANMTGKSTFLRTIGINMVLAMNGCPVCAESFYFYPISLFTSMRTSDSLTNGSSYFNAEIKRLKLLIEKLESDEPQFIILDEILKGTNSVDKLKGSEMFLEKIIKMRTSMNCIIATHDIELTKMENVYPNNIINYCFELHTEGRILKPDYKLRRGVTKSMNAISLMKELKIID